MEDEFRPINTQEEFDARVKEVHGDVAGLQGRVKTLEGEKSTLETNNAQLQKQVKGYETTALKQRIAKEKGIPADMAARLSGEEEKDIRADADSMAAALRAFKGAAPLADHQEHAEEGNRAGLRNLLRGLRGE